MTRDSWLFSWPAVLMMIAIYFAVGGDPRGYDFERWLQSFVVISGIILAKLGTSPLRGEHDDTTVTVR
jgi:hypothetical protein